MRKTRKFAEMSGNSAQIMRKVPFQNKEIILYKIPYENKENSF